MKATIKNTSRALQGVQTVSGLRFIEPGASATLDVSESYVDRVNALPFLDAQWHREAPKPPQADVIVGEEPATPPYTATGVRVLWDAGHASDEQLRAFIEHRDGRKPHPATSREKLIAKATEDTSVAGTEQHGGEDKPASEPKLEG